MRRWILLGILVITVGWGGWTLFRRHRQAVRHQRENMLSQTYNEATQAFYNENYGLAEKLFTDILPDTEKSFPSDSRLADLLSMLGTSYREDHNYEQAEPILKRALEVYERISPPDPVGTARTEANLAGIYTNREDYASAEPYLSDALSLTEKAPNRLAYERGNILLKLGSVRVIQGRYPEAEQLLNRSVEALTPYAATWAQKDLASAFYWLGAAYAMEDRYTEAKRQYLEALRIQEKLVGPNSLDLGHTLKGLGEAYQAEGNISKATELLSRAEKIAQHSSTPGDGSRAELLLGLGEAAQAGGRYAKAESLYKQAIDIYEKTVGPRHPDYARGLAYLGCMYRDQPQFDISKADPLLEGALAIREKALGPDHPYSARALSDLSLLRFYEQKFQEAERLAHQALPIQEKAYGSESLEVGATLNRLGLAQRDLKKLAEAETSFKRALSIREKNLPPNHPWIAVSLDNLASVYLAQGEFEKAAPLIKRAQAIRLHASAG